MEKEILEKQLEELRERKQMIDNRMAANEDWDRLKEVVNRITKITHILSDIECFGFDRNLYSDEEVEEYIANCKSCQPVSRCDSYCYHRYGCCAGVVSGGDLTDERNRDATELRKWIRIHRQKVYG